jgi:hydroxyacylglutathione hydrolase
VGVFIEVVKSDGLAHLSYLLGYGRQCVVVDPRRDVSIYMDVAAGRGARITNIFETHRNEDFVSGSVALAASTGATIHHGRKLTFSYGKSVGDGDVFRLGSIRLEILETPGHTDESICIVVKDADSGDDAVAVFTGDTLFVGDVGRADFFPDRKAEVAGLLYDSLFEKLLPLGDQTIIFPAHGAGSVCGNQMAEREFSTIGFERRNNPMLLVESRDAFIHRKVGEHHEKPAYFKKMEEFNLKGNAPAVGVVRPPLPLTPSECETAMADGLQLVDCRSPEAFAGAFIPGSLAIPLSLMSTYAGYFLRYDSPIGLVAQNMDAVQSASEQLCRLGYDNLRGYLADGLEGWEMSGRRYDRIPAVHAAELVYRIKTGADFVLLDVRKASEFNRGHLPGAKHLFLGHLPGGLEEIPRSTPVTTFCGSGTRAIVAASILKKAGFDDVEDALGSMAACNAIGCPIEP